MRSSPDFGHHRQPARSPAPSSRQAPVIPRAGSSVAGAAPAPTSAVLAVRRRPCSRRSAACLLPSTVAEACAELAASLRDAGHRVVADADILMVRTGHAGCAMNARRALVIAPTLPEFDREGGSRDVADMIRFLTEAGWSISFVAGTNNDGDRYVRQLEGSGVDVHCSRRTGSRAPSLRAPRPMSS